MLLQLFKSLTHPVYRIISYLQCNAHSQKHIIIMFQELYCETLSIIYVFSWSDGCLTALGQSYKSNNTPLCMNDYKGIIYTLHKIFISFNKSFILEALKERFVCKAVWRSLSVSSLILLCKESCGSLQLHPKETQTHLAAST